ncbi:hypothetical protein PICSAR164_02093 [Mycobacterium avium subsp. paratuberculosis]|nr:hypothetical protein PICSAR164_02093 [Mycobacterium avium subsp. paratuberculosis]
MAARNAGRFAQKSCSIFWMFWKNWDSCWMKFCHQSPELFWAALAARLLASPPGLTMDGAGAVRGAAASAEPATA